MTRQARNTFLSSVALAAFFLTANQSFAIEPGDFNATLAGATIGAFPLGAAPPPGLYASTQSFVGPNAVGTGRTKRSRRRERRTRAHRVRRSRIGFDSPGQLATTSLAAAWC